MYSERERETFNSGVAKFTELGKESGSWEYRSGRKLVLRIEEAIVSL